MLADLYTMTFHGGILRRGFWLYVWEIRPPDGEAIYYVGRTGDSSSTRAQSPFNRMGQHLGFAATSNMLRKHLEKHRVEPETCTFRLVALGPVEEESTAEERHEHDARRDRVGAMEKALADLMVQAGYRVANSVYCRKPLNQERFEAVRSAFAREFVNLARGAT
jgi:hypothetical protein